MGQKQNGGDAKSAAQLQLQQQQQQFEWGKGPDVAPTDEKDPNDIVLQSWAFCKSKPSPVKHYRSDVEERERRLSLQWRKRASFVELDCGEDSFFVSNTYRTLGVADGVGGWKDEGVDPAQFSNKLMENAKAYSETHRKDYDPERIMHNAFEKLKHDKAVRAGSSTCCIASLVEDSGKWWLDFANLGDSGALVIRNRDILHRVHEKIHGFSQPFQLAVLPEHLKGRAYSDRVTDSIRERVEVQVGDVVLLGTDGLFDNRYNSQLAADAGWVGTVADSILEKIPVFGFLLSSAFSTGDQKIEYTDPYRVVQRVVSDTYKNSLSKDADTPWASMLQEYGVKDAKGGKVDDITCLMARVSTREELAAGIVW
ncbi:protein phosphatase, putative [Bodo saltans]|uniref:Protein phosphatase n=1 Tax=Bodo saltans TaxID=75058 RepID=A0A0S4JS91_BODSA|nr:protein phosphatase, putative [Bodo saltans]|eukprot:CUG91958.1 protein phosphatase, putative [Bodo saltans]